MKIKQQPSDFIVEEVIDYELDDNGEYTYFWLNKENWTTMRAINIISKICRTSHKRFKFAGTKDKFAITKQLVSAWNIKPEKLEQVKLKDIEIDIVGKGNTPISLGTLKGNKFEIIVREVSDKEIKVFKKKSKEIEVKGFINYFGEQRFGRGNTHLIGKEILKGNLEQAVKEIIIFVGEKESDEAKAARNFGIKNWGKWVEILKGLPRHLNIEKAVLNHLIKVPTDFAGAMRNIPKTIRKMYIHAYQSWIFNSALKESKTKSGNVELPGFKTELGNDVYSKTVKKLLKKDGIELEDFACKRMPELASEGQKRQVIIKPKNFGADINKDIVKLKFELSKGIYATELIKSLF